MRDERISYHFITPAARFADSFAIFAAMRDIGLARAGHTHELRRRRDITLMSDATAATPFDCLSLPAHIQSPSGMRYFSDFDYQFPRVTRLYGARASLCYERRRF